MEAIIYSNPQHVQRLIDLYMPLRQAWKQVELESSAGQLQVSDPAQQAGNQSTSESNPAGSTAAEMPRTQWNA
jgi:hypothetical protein